MLLRFCHFSSLSIVTSHLTQGRRHDMHGAVSALDSALELKHTTEDLTIHCTCWLSVECRVCWLLGLGWLSIGTPVGLGWLTVGLDDNQNCWTITWLTIKLLIIGTPGVNWLTDYCVGWFLVGWQWLTIGLAVVSTLVGLVGWILCLTIWLTIGGLAVSQLCWFLVGWLLVWLSIKFTGFYLAF